MMNIIIVLGGETKMINIKKCYKNICLITEDNYSEDRFPIYSNLFKKFNIDILDYTIQIKDENPIFEKTLDLESHSVDTDFLTVLKEFNLLAGDDEFKDCKFIFNILAVINIKKEGIKIAL